MPLMAPPMTVWLRERLPLQRGARAQTCESSAETLQLRFAFASPRLHLRPSERCLEHLDAPRRRDLRAPLAGERGQGPRTRHTRFAAITSCRRVIA
jgi:integrase/recombinase XerD